MTLSVRKQRQEYCIIFEPADLMRIRFSLYPSTWRKSSLTFTSYTYYSLKKYHDLLDHMCFHAPIKSGHLNSDPTMTQFFAFRLSHLQQPILQKKRPPTTPLLYLEVSKFNGGTDGLRAQKILRKKLQPRLFGYELRHPELMEL
jgi:hypothetical protein